jgi:predicted DNA-binding protein (MmcQ/YjbR family)
MDAERARQFLLSLPHVRETMQWGDNLVFWVGDKTAGGRMFALVNLSADAHGAVSFAAGPERFAELVEQEGFKRAPYLARAHWVATERWDVARDREWQDLLGAAHVIVLAKLSKRVRDSLTESVKSSGPRAEKKAARSRSSFPRKVSS